MLQTHHRLFNIPIRVFVIPSGTLHRFAKFWAQGRPHSINKQDLGKRILKVDPVRLHDNEWL